MNCIKILQSSWLICNGNQSNLNLIVTMNRSSLVKATRADATPTPGFLLKEIAEATYAAPNACHQLEAFLFSKLSSTEDPYVKVKTLQVIRHVSLDGKPDFKLLVRKKSNEIKSCLQYSCKDDPILGDSLAKSVRNEAQHCLEAVFASENHPSTASSVHKKIEGFGVNNIVERNIGVSAPPQFNAADGARQFQSNHSLGFTKSMQGLGNPYFDQSTKTVNPSEMVARGMAQVAAAARQYVPDNILQSLDSWGVNIPMFGGTDNSVSSPSFGSTPYQMSYSEFDGVSRSNDDTVSHYSITEPPLNRILKTEECSSMDGSPCGGAGLAEVELVDRIMNYGEFRISPSPQTLTTFCNDASKLDLEVILTLLLNRLVTDQDGTSWQECLRALCILDALLSSAYASTEIRSAAKRYLSADGKQCIKSVYENVPNCKSRAWKILREFEEPISQSSNSSAAIEASVITSEQTEDSRSRHGAFVNNRRKSACLLDDTDLQLDDYPMPNEKTIRGRATSSHDNRNKSSILPPLLLEETFKDASQNRDKDDGELICLNDNYGNVKNDGCVRNVGNIGHLNSLIGPGIIESQKEEFSKNNDFSNISNLDTLGVSPTRVSGSGTTSSFSFINSS